MTPAARAVAIAWATIRAAPLPEPVLPGAQPHPGDHRCGGVGADRGHQRRESFAQDLFAGDLGMPVGGALFGVSVDRAQQRVDVDEGAHLGAGQQIDARTQRDQCSRSTDSSWRACPKLNSRNNVPIVDGAYTPPNRVFIPPVRSTSTSSMLSAPAHMPAISVASFGAGFADPDLILGSAMRTFSASSSDSPVCSASVITGTSPAHDTRLSSSNTAESAAKSMRNLHRKCLSRTGPIVA